MRDKILGHIPHSTLNDWRYLAVAGLAVSWFSCGMAEWFTMAGSSLLLMLSD